jgi:hypothetical protein
MNTHLRRFFRSPLGLAVLGSDLVAAVALSASGVLPPWIAVPLFALLYVVEAVALMQTSLGSGAVVAEGDRERKDRDASILGAVAVARKRLSLLKPADSSVAASIDRLVLASGHYLEACVKGSDRDPVVEDAVLGAVEAVDDYLRMLDARSMAKRIRSAQKDPQGTVAREDGSREAEDRRMPEQGGEGEAGAGRQHIEAVTVRVLDKAAEEIETRLNLPLGGARDGVAAQDRMDAREDML